jgi:Caspase domain
MIPRRRWKHMMWVAVVTLVALGAFMDASLAASRAALVIGNSAYPFGPLVNPKNDAELMAQSLKQVGFEVTTVLDADRQTMQRALLDFSRAIRDTDTVGLFYFAGHGVQSAGENYLIPVDADIKSESEVKLFGINVDEFVATLERANGRTNIVILDSCRNNPFPKISRSGSRGLAAVSAPTGTFIAQSTSPGQVALDGEGDNSPYAMALSKALLEPGATIEQVFKQTRRDVLKQTKDVQTPWDTSSLTGDFYFSEPAKAVEVAAPEPVVQPPTAEEQAGPQVVEDTPQVAVNEPAPETPQRQMQEITVEPRIYPVGKWPEGLVHTGDFLWIAESGARQMVKLNRATGKIETKVPTGRLPVSMATDGNGTVFSAAFTDCKITRQSPPGKTKTLATIKNRVAFADMRYGLDALYAATYTDDGANRLTTLNRIDPKSGAVTPSEAFLGEARGLATAEGTPFMLYATGNGTEVAAFDQGSVSKGAGIPLEGFNWSIAANRQFIYVGGREEQQGGNSTVTLLPVEDLGNKTRQSLEGQELIMTIAATDVRVAALGDGGGVWILEATTLAPLKHFNSGVRPQQAIFADGILYVTTHQGDGENGAVYAFEGLLE